MNKSLFKGTKCHKVNNAQCANSIGAAATPLQNRFQVLSQKYDDIVPCDQSELSGNTCVSVARHVNVGKMSMIENKKTSHRRTSVSTDSNQSDASKSSPIQFRLL